MPEEEAGQDPPKGKLKLRCYLLRILIALIVVLIVRWGMWEASDYYFGQAIPKWNSTLYKSKTPLQACDYAISCLETARSVDPWVVDRYPQYDEILKGWKDEREQILKEQSKQ